MTTPVAGGSPRLSAPVPSRADDELNMDLDHIAGPLTKNTWMAN